MLGCSAECAAGGAGANGAERAGDESPGDLHRSLSRALEIGGGPPAHAHPDCYREHTITIHRLVNAELARLLPRAQSVTIPNAGHGSPRENPEAFNAAVLAFLAAHAR